MQSRGLGVGDERLGQVVSPRGLWRRLVGQREEDDAPQDHGQDPADDHDQPLVEAVWHDMICTTLVRCLSYLPLAERAHGPEARHGHQPADRQEDSYVEDGLGLGPAKLVHAQGGPETGDE